MPVHFVIIYFNLSVNVFIQIQCQHINCIILYMPNKLLEGTFHSSIGVFSDSYLASNKICLTIWFKQGTTCQGMFKKKM